MKFNIGKFIRRHGHQIAGALAILGLGATVYTTGKAAIKVNNAIKAAENEKGATLSFKEKVNTVKNDKETRNSVIMATVATTVTGGAIVAGAGFAEAAITATSTAMAVTAKKAAEFKADVAKISPETYKEVVEQHQAKIADVVPVPIKKDPTKVLYYLTLTDEYFYGDLELPRRVASQMNILMEHKGHYSVEDIRQAFGLAPEKDPEKLQANRVSGYDQFSFFNTCKYPDLEDDPKLCGTLVFVEWVQQNQDGTLRHVLDVSHEPTACLYLDDREYIVFSDQFSVR